VLKDIDTAKSVILCHMPIVQKKLSRSFKNFFGLEKSSGILLVIGTGISLLLANSTLGIHYSRIWQFRAGGMSVEHWINDGLMAIFFLLIGVELERELYNGELSNFKNALLPICAAMGGICLPASIHFVLNAGTPTQAGMEFQWRRTLLLPLEFLRS